MGTTPLFCGGTEGGPCIVDWSSGGGAENVKEACVCTLGGLVTGDGGGLILGEDVGGVLVASATGVLWRGQEGGVGFNDVATAVEGVGTGLRETGGGLAFATETLGTTGCTHDVGGGVIWERSGVD